jgi:hypothetical protein
MQFTIELSREERHLLLRGVWAQQDNINCEITELNAIDKQWAKDEAIILEDKIRQLKILAIKIEG